MTAHFIAPADDFGDYPFIAEGDYDPRAIQWAEDYGYTDLTQAVLDWRHDTYVTCEHCLEQHHPDDEHECDPEVLAEVNFDPVREHGTLCRRIAL